MTTEDRLSALELELARAKQRTRWALALAVAALGLFAGSYLPGWTREAHAQEQSVPDEIRARSFVAVDWQGRPRATLNATDLSLCDGEGKPRVMLGAPAEGPTLALYDGKGKIRAILGAAKDGPELDLSDENGDARVILSVMKIKGKDWPGLRLGKSGEPYALLGVFEAGPSLGLFEPVDGKFMAFWSTPSR